MRNIIYDFARFVGARIRFYFLKLIGFPKPLKYLEGNSNDYANKISHGCINTFIGIPIAFGIIIGIAYLYFRYFDISVH